MVFLHAITITRAASQSSHCFISLRTGLHQLQRIINISSNPFTSYSSSVDPSLFHSASCASVEEGPLHEHVESPGCPEETKDSSAVFREWGCTEAEISKILERRPSLHKTNTHNLHSKLQILSQLGIKSTDLVKIVHCRPRFLSCKINACLDGRLQYLESLFGSKDVLVKAIVRNPSLLRYDFHKKIKPVISIYESLGLSRPDIIAVLLSRPTLIPRTNLDNEKIAYIRRTGVPKESKMYKHVVSLFAISRIETIREKVMNLERYGLSEDDICGLIGRSPLVLTLSVDKVQRHMTFILGTMKLPANVVIRNPFLLYFNLETVLKPRFSVACKIEDMGLSPGVKGAALLRALRMSDKRFVSAFISCHPPSVDGELLATYRDAKCIKRLAESSKKNSNKRFPF